MDEDPGFLYDADGNPYHGVGARIYQDSDGTLIRYCPNCGLGPVAPHMRAAMEKYAQNRVESGWAHKHEKPIRPG